MPRIAKWKEKSQCVKYFRENQEFRFYDDTTPLNRIYETLYDLIDKTIEDAMRNGYNPIDVMSQYADVKEVPKWEI